MAEHKLITDIKKNLKKTNLCDDVISHIISFICPNKYEYVKFSFTITKTLNYGIDLKFMNYVHYCPNCRKVFYTNICTGHPKVTVNTHLLRCSAMYRKPSMKECLKVLGKMNIYDRIKHEHRDKNPRINGVDNVRVTTSHTVILNQDEKTVYVYY